MNVNVYVDGYNLFYGAIKGTKFHWLDLQQFSSRILDEVSRHHAPELSGASIGRICYCSALASATASDPDQPTRQQTYWRALQTLPDFELRLGKFKNNRGLMPKEKGSDVNLATELLIDAFDDRFDACLIITNDSDLCGPIDLVRSRFRKSVVIAMPVLNNNADGKPRRPSTDLRAVSDYQYRIDRWTQGHLRASQFPDEIQDDLGNVISKPARWR